MFSDIRRFVNLSYDCSVLTSQRFDDKPMDLMVNDKSTEYPNYFIDPSVCLSSISS